MGTWFVDCQTEDCGGIKSKTMQNTFDLLLYYVKLKSG